VDLGSQIFDYWFDESGFVLEHYSDGDMVNSDCVPTREAAGKDTLHIWGPECAPYNAWPLRRQRKLCSLLILLRLRRRVVLLPSFFRRQRIEDSARRNMWHRGNMLDVVICFVL
jgi:hypothetical protein